MSTTAYKIWRGHLPSTWHVGVRGFSPSGWINVGCIAGTSEPSSFESREAAQAYVDARLASERSETTKSAEQPEPTKTERFCSPTYTAADWAAKIQQMQQDGA